MGYDDKKETKEEKKPKAYISDLRLFVAGRNNIKKVIKKAEEEGYSILMNGEDTVSLNKGTKFEAALTTDPLGLNGDVLLGYKESQDVKDAIYDLKMLEMDHGYEWFNYQKIVEGQSENVEGLASDLMIAGEEFSNNLKNGSRAAKAASEFLNLLFFTKKISFKNAILQSNPQMRILLGDYLSSGDMEPDMLKKLIIQMNGGSLTAMYSQLSLGVSEEGETWADRIEKTDTFKEKNTESDKYKIWDKSYYVYAMDLLPVLKDYATAYRQMEVRKENNGGEVEGVSADKVSEDDNADISAKSAEKIIEASEKDNSGDIIYEVAHGILNKRKAGDEGVGDYILRLAESGYEKRSDYRKLYPLVEALTQGQFAMIKISGLSQMALYLNLSDDYFQELEERKKTVVADIKKATGEETASVWEGVNREFYEREVALTSDAYRESKASSLYTELTRQGEFYDNMNLAFMGVGLVSSVAGIITGGITIGLTLAGSGLSVWAACAGCIGTGVFATIGGIIGCAAVIAGWVALAAIVILAIVYFVKWLSDLFSDDDEDEYSTMPTEIYDIVQGKVDGKKVKEFVKYDAVTNSDESPQDLNSNHGKRWNLLYYSKNSHIGSPLCVDELNRSFVQTVKSPETPEGYQPVTCFGERMAANMNAYSRGNKESIYLHYITVDTLNEVANVDDEITGEYEVSDAEEDFGGKVNKGSAVKLKKGEKYLNALFISSEKSESAAKAAITQKPGYKVYDKNLTPGKGFTYLGYSSTTVKKEAVRDIRIMPNYQGEAILYGNAEYVSAGQLPGGVDLIYTQYETAGPPIIDTFKISDKKLGDKAEGWEPVNTFGGGDAYNGGKNEKNGLYMYFKPAILYTSGDKYIAGIVFVSEQKGEKTRSAKELAEDMGLKVYDYNLTTGMDYLSKHKFLLKIGLNNPTCTWSSHNQYVCCSYTYNPYRAICDAALHTGTTRMKQMPLSFNSTDGFYTATESYIVTNKAFSEGYDIILKYRGYEELEDVYLMKSRAYSNPYSDSELIEKIVDSRNDRDNIDIKDIGMQKKRIS